MAVDIVRAKRGSAILRVDAFLTQLGSPNATSGNTGTRTQRTARALDALGVKLGATDSDITEFDAASDAVHAALLALPTHEPYRNSADLWLSHAWAKEVAARSPDPYVMFGACMRSLAGDLMTDVPWTDEALAAMQEEVPEYMCAVRRGAGAGLPSWVSYDTNSTPGFLLSMALVSAQTQVCANMTPSCCKMCV